MAKIENYSEDNGLRSEDKLIGSSYVETINGIDKYATRSYNLDDLGTYFSTFYYDGTGYSTLSDRVLALESAAPTTSTQLTTIQTDVTNLKSAFIINGETGDIESLSAELNSGINTLINEADLATNPYFGDLSTDLTNFLNGFVLDSNGLPTGFGDTLLENIEGVAQGAIDLTSYASSNQLDVLDGALDKVKAAFTFDINGNVDNFNTVLATATENKARAVVTAEGVAYANDVDQIKTAVGTWDENNNLVSLSTGLSSKINVIVTTSTGTIATNVENLRAGFGTFDENGVPTSFSDALQTNIQSVIALEDYAAGVDFRGVQTIVQGEDGNGGLVQSMALAEDDITAVSTLSNSTATKTTNLSAKFGTFDENNNFVISTSSDYFNQVKTYVDEDSALASSVESLSTTVGEHTTSINTYQESIDGIEGRYGVEVDENGRITGFQIIGGTDRSDFIINAEKFLIYNGSTNSTPFVLDSSQLKLNVPLNGVSGTFSGNLVVDKITIDDNDITIKSDVVPGDGGSVRFADSLSSVVGYLSGQEAEGFKGTTMYGLQRVNLNAGANASISMLGGSGLAHNIYINGNLYSYDNIQTQTDLSVGGDTVLSGEVQMNQYPALNNQNGYKKLTGGTIIQWGRVLQNSVTITVTFPIQFPNACRSITATKGSAVSVATQNNACTVNQFTTSNFKIDSNDAVADHYVWWIAIGY